MSYRGDIRLGDTIDVKFTTRKFSTGAPFALAGTPVISAYVGNGTTQITAGITLTTDFDTVTGLNNVRVVATSGNGYATATNVDLVITTGTVDSVSVVGEVIGSFSIENRSAVMPTTAARTLDVSAGGEAGVDWANVGSPTTVVGLSGTTVKTATDVETDTAAIETRVTTALPNAAAGASGGLVRVGSNDAATSFTAGLTISNTGGNALSLSSSGGNGHGLAAAGNGSGDGISSIGGGTGHGMQLIGGLTSGDGLHTHGMGTGHGILAEAHGTGTGLSANITGNITGNVSGSVGSVTGAVGSVTGAVGSVTGLTASDVGAIKAKTDSLAFTVPGQVDANIQYVNDVLVTGDGGTGTEWGP